MPLAATDNGDGTSTLKVDTELTATIDPTGLATSAKQDTGNSSLSSINAKLPTLVGGKIPVDASVSIDAIDIGNVDITEFPAGNLGQQLKAASLSVAPATDITDATYLGDIKFGESLPAGSAIVGKVGIDQTTPGTTNLVNVNGGASQTSDIKVTLDSEKVAVSAIDAGTNLIGKVSIDQVTANANEVVVKSQTPPATLPLPTGAATSANQPGLEGTDKAKTSVYVKKSANADTVLTLGKAADADSLPVALSTETLAALETISLTGSLPDTAATDLAHIHAKVDNLNVGDQAKAASISVTPATDITDGRYIGDIKFGESAPLDLDYSTGATSSKTIRVKLSNEDLTALENITVDAVVLLPTKAPATVTGTCAAAYATALTWTGLQNIPSKTIIVVNTDATLTMKYRIRGYAKSGSTYYNEIQAEYTLAASTSQPHVIQNSYDVITVEVIDGTGHATYAIDYSGGQ